MADTKYKIVKWTPATGRTQYQIRRLGPTGKWRIIERFATEREVIEAYKQIVVDKSEEL